QVSSRIVCMICNSTETFVAAPEGSNARRRAAAALRRLQLFLTIATFLVVEHRVWAQSATSFQPQSSWSPTTGQSPAGSEAQYSGLLAPRSASSGSGWLNPPTSASGFTPLQP